MNETEILCNKNDPNLQSWCKRPFWSKKSNRIIMFFLIQECSHLSIVFGSSRPVGSCFHSISAPLKTVICSFGFMGEILSKELNTYFDCLFLSGVSPDVET